MDRVALVTGGSRGIGRAICEMFGQRGYRVAVGYASNETAAAETVSSLSKLGGSGITVGGDVGRADDRRRMLEETLGAFGRLDVLINNAGITSPGRTDLLDLTEESWDAVFAINLKGPFFLAQAAARVMIEQRTRDSQAAGKIINISSISAYAVSTNRVDYCLTKAAQPMLTQQLAVRLAEYGIGVFEICPGIIETDMTGPVKEKYDRLIADGLTPIRRWGKPDDIARCVSAIVDDSFPFSTGERFNVDGGFHIRVL
jgi:NAD(P)-dependent dehydrogenase (short-subunit alcohol dehydrogenase family)